MNYKYAFGQFEKIAKIPLKKKQSIIIKISKYLNNMSPRAPDYFSALKIKLIKKETEMNNKKIKYSIYIKTIPLILSVLFSVNTANAETIQKAWETAVKNDKTISESRQLRLSSGEEISAAKARHLPSLTGKISYNVLDESPSTAIEIYPMNSIEIPFMEDNKYSVSELNLTIPVFTSGRISNGVNAAESVFAASKANEEKIIKDIKLNVAKYYVSVLRVQKNVEALKTHVLSLEGHFKDVKNLFENQIVPKNDLLSVEVALADAKQNLLKGENKLDIAKSAYNRLLGRKLDTPVDLEKIKFTKELPEIEKLNLQALQKREELIILKERQKALGFRAKAVKAEVMPQVALQGSFYNVTNTVLEDQQIWQASIGLSWNLFDGGMTRHKALAVQKKELAAGERKKEVQSIICLQIRQAWLDLKEASLRIKVTETALKQSLENLNVTKNRYKQEIGTNTEVLDAETLRTKTLTNHSNAVYDAVMADFRLNRAAGSI